MKPSARSFPYNGSSSYSQDLYAPYPGPPAHTSNQSTPFPTFNFSKPLISSSTSETQKSGPLPISSHPLTTFSSTSLPGTTQPINHGHTDHELTVTVSTSTVTQNISEFIGDNRFPPIRPPINSGTFERRSRPDQTVSLNHALASCSNIQNPSSISEDTVKTSMQIFFQLLNSAKVATNSITSKQLEPHVTQGALHTVLDPLPFHDPEHECHHVCDDDGQPTHHIPRKTRFLSNKEANRLWNLTTVPDRQTRSEILVLGSQLLHTVTKHRTGNGSFTNSLPQANPDVTSHPFLCSATDSGVQTSAERLAPRLPYPKLTRVTPQDRCYLEYVLDNRLDPSPVRREHWVHNIISQMIMRVGPLGLRLRPPRHSDNIPCPLLTYDALADTSKADDRFERECGMTAGIPSVCAHRESKNEPTGISLTSEPSSAGPSSPYISIKKTRRGRGRKHPTPTFPPSPPRNIGKPNLHGVQLHSTCLERTTGTFPVEEIILDLDTPSVGKTTPAAMTPSTVSTSPVPVSATCITTVELLPPAKVQVLEEAKPRIERLESHRADTGGFLESTHTLSQRIEFSDRRSQETLPDAPPRGDIWVSVFRGRIGRVVADRSSLRLPSDGDHQGDNQSTTSISLCFPNLGPLGTASLRLPKVATPTEDMQAIPASNFGEPALVRSHRRRRHRFTARRKKPTNENLAAVECTVVTQVAQVPLQDSESHIESWGERRRSTWDSPPCPVSNDTGPPNATTATHPSGANPCECSRNDSSGGPHSTAYTLSPSTKGPTDTGGGLPPDSTRCHTNCALLGWEVESPAQSAIRDDLVESALPPPVPAPIEVVLDRGGNRYKVEVRATDWAEAFQLDMSAHPDIAVCLAWRRHVRTQLGHGNYRQPTIRLVSREAVDLPKESWPTSWEGLVEHVNKGGSFRGVARMRGGMNPDMQALLASTVSNDSLLWESLDRDPDSVWIGPPVPVDAQTDMMHLTWPTSWDGLVEHVNKGGSFRGLARMRGGMNPDMQALLASTVSNDSLMWESFDRDSDSVWIGLPVPVDAQTDMMHLTLASDMVLQHSNSLESTLLTLWRGETTGDVLPPPRLAAQSAVTFVGIGEKALRVLMSHAGAHPCPVGGGTGAAAGAPDNPGAAQH